MNFFEKIPHLRYAQGEFSDFFDEVPQGFEPTRAVPVEVDYKEFTDTLYNMYSVLTDNTIATNTLIDTYSSYSPSYGVIPEPYLTYFSSLYAKSVLQDYVAFVTQERSGNYTTTVYNMFISPDLTYSGSSFSGSGTLYKYYTSSRWPTYTYNQDNNFYLSISSGAVFSSLPGPFPDFTVSYVAPRLVLYALFFAFLCYSFKSFFSNVVRKFIFPRR